MAQRQTQFLVVKQVGTTNMPSNLKVDRRNIPNSAVEFGQKRGFSSKTSLFVKFDSRIWNIASQKHQNKGHICCTQYLSTADMHLNDM